MKPHIYKIGAIWICYDKSIDLKDWGLTPTMAYARYKIKLLCLSKTAQ